MIYWSAFCGVILLGPSDMLSAQVIFTDGSCVTGQASTRMEIYIQLASELGH